MRSRKLLKPWTALWLFCGAATAMAVSCGGKSNVVIANAQFDLTIEVVGEGTVTSAPPLFSCMGPATCGPKTVTGVTETVLTATPAVGFAFLQWEPEGQASSTAPSLGIGSESGDARRVRATFVPLRSDAMDASVVDAAIEGGRLDAGPVDASVRDASVDAGDVPYLAVCLGDLAGTDVTRSYRFVADVTVSGATPKIVDVTLAPLSNASRALSRAQIVRSTTVFPSAPLDTVNAFSHSAPRMDLAAAANPFANVATRIEPFKQAGTFVPGSFCTSFGANITQPTSQATSGVCRYIQAPEGTPFSFAADGLSMKILTRTLTRAGFVCP